MEKYLRAGILLLTITMFWGIIYPQYALTEDMYRIVGEEQGRGRDCAADYRNIMTAKRGEVEIRFAFLEKIEELLGEREKDGHGRE